MTEFITRNHGHSCYEIMIKTTDPEHYKATQDFVRLLIDQANGVTFAEDTNVPRKGHWIIRSSGKGKYANNWAECSECHVCGSPQWKVCPVCEAKMGYVEKIEPIKSCTDCENDGFDMPQCKHCSPDNDFMYFQRKSP